MNRSASGQLWSKLTGILQAAARYTYLENARSGPRTCKDVAYCVRMLSAMGESAASPKIAVPVGRLLELVRRDRSDGDEYLLSWESEPYDTAMAVSALARLGRTIDDPTVSSAAEWMVSQEDSPDRPFVYGELWETALSCRALLEVGYYARGEMTRGKLTTQLEWIAETTGTMCGRLGDHYAGTALQVLSVARGAEPRAVSEAAQRHGDGLANYLVDRFRSLKTKELWTPSPWANGRCLEGLVGWRPEWAAESSAVSRVINWFGREQGKDGSWNDSMVETHDSFFGLLRLAAALEARGRGDLAPSTIPGKDLETCLHGIFADVRSTAPDPLVYKTQACPRGDPYCTRTDPIGAAFKTPNAFLVVPYDAAYEGTLARLQEVLREAGVAPILAKEMAGEELFCTVCRGIRSAHFVVADISAQRRHNMPFELGLALGLGKKACVLCQKDPLNPDSFPPRWISDLGGRRLVGYEPDEVDVLFADWILRERASSLPEGQLGPLKRRAKKLSD